MKNSVKKIMTIDSLITVRSTSGRLFEKCFLPFGECNVIEHVIRRAKYFSFKPLLCTTLDQEDDRLVRIAENEKIPFYRGSTVDKLMRWKNACEKFEINKFLTIDGDDPFFDKSLGKLSLSLLGDNNFISHPNKLPYEGCVGYSISYDLIKKACELKKSKDTEMMWHFLEPVPSLRKKELEVNNYDLNIRLTLDYIEDYWLILFVLRNLGPFAEIDKIINLFKNNPDLHKMNWFRNIEYKQNHNLKVNNQY
ncbi:MAG: hypothetical protein CMI95_01795 [Pelagibacteraceae bacterium]|nr:hypothetical protein [Pelagibacteraceae bacterium]